MKIKASKIKLNDFFDKAFAKGRDEHKEQEKAKLNTYRVASTGIKGENAPFVGVCPRKALLRFHGIEVEEDSIVRQGRTWMFEAGRKSEEILQSLLTSAGFDTYTDSDKEAEVIFATKAGTKGSGHPDLTKKPEKDLIIECKMIGSVWTAKSVSLDSKPKMAHLIQLTQYMKAHGTAGKLLYVQYIDFQIPPFPDPLNYCPKPGELGSHILDYRERKHRQSGNKYMAPFKIYPHVTIYNLSICDEGFVSYKREDRPWENAVPTIINVKDIERYSEALDECSAKDILPPRPENIEADGKKASYSMCDKLYCPLAATCKACDDKPLSTFMDEVRKL